MKIAKATPEDMKACLDLVGLLNTVDDGYYPSTEEGDETFFDPNDTAHLRLLYDQVKACMKKAPGGLNRVVWGFCCAMDSNVFDHNLDHLDLNPKLRGEGAVIIKGKVCEVGLLLEYCDGWGITLQSEGEIIEVTGLTEEDCQAAEKWLGKDLTITIAACDEVPEPGPAAITGDNDGDLG